MRRPRGQAPASPLQRWGHRVRGLRRRRRQALPRGRQGWTPYTGNLAVSSELTVFNIPWAPVGRGGRRLFAASAACGVNGHGRRRIAAGRGRPGQRRKRVSASRRRGRCSWEVERRGARLAACCCLIFLFPHASVHSCVFFCVQCLLRMLGGGCSRKRCTRARTHLERTHTPRPNNRSPCNTNHTTKFARCSSALAPQRM